MRDTMDVESFAANNLIAIALGLLICGGIYAAGGLSAVGVIAVPLGIVVGYNSCAAMHGDIDGVKSYAYVAAGLITVTFIQHVLF